VIEAAASCGMALMSFLHRCVILAVAIQSLTEAADDRFLMVRMAVGDVSSEGRSSGEADGAVGESSKAVKTKTRVELAAKDVNANNSTSEVGSVNNSMNVTAEAGAIDALRAVSNATGTVPVADRTEEFTHIANSTENTTAANSTENTTATNSTETIRAALVENVASKVRLDVSHIQAPSEAMGASNSARNSTQEGSFQQAANVSLAQPDSSFRSTEHTIQISEDNEQDFPSVDGPQGPVFHTVLYLLLVPAAVGIWIFWAVCISGSCWNSGSKFQKLLDDPRTPKRLGRSQSGGRVLEFPQQQLDP